MSNIGKQPISIPEGVEVNQKGTEILVKGKLGELSYVFHPDSNIAINDQEIIITRSSDEKSKENSMGGLGF